MRRKLLIAITVFALVVTIALLWPTAGYDLNRVHPKLRELSQPFRSVQAGYFLDGGSIGMTLADSSGRVLKLALPVALNGGQTYPRLFLGATHIKGTNAVEVEFTKDTRRMLIALIERHDSTVDGMASLCAIRGAPRDYARTIAYHFLGRFDQPTTTP